MGDIIRVDIMELDGELYFQIWPSLVLVYFGNMC